MTLNGAELGALCDVWRVRLQYVPSMGLALCKIGRMLSPLHIWWGSVFPHVAAITLTRACHTTCNISAAANDQGWNKTSSHPGSWSKTESWCEPCLYWSAVMCLYLLFILLYCCAGHYCSLAWNFLIKARINKWSGEDHRPSLSHAPHHHPLSAVLGSSRIVIGVTK